MSYKIDTVRYLSGQLTCNHYRAVGYSDTTEDQLPEDCFLYDAIHCKKEDRDEELPLTRVAWNGEFADDLDAFLRALAVTGGGADLLVVWGGGDRMDGVRVGGGIAARKKVKVVLEDS